MDDSRETTTVAVLGTGVMGAGMARSLRRDGFTVTAWNRSHDKAASLADDGVVVCAEVADAVAEADVVLTMLFDVSSVLDVMEGAVPSLPEEVLWLQCSTVGVEGIERVRDLAQAHGIDLVDAPVAGTRKPAEEGNLVVLASGRPDLVRRASPVLGAIGARTVVAGEEIGAASALKLVVNSWVATLTAALGESLALAEGLSLDPQLFLDSIKGGPTDAPYAHVKGALMVADDFPVSFSVDGVVKDVGLIVEAGRATGVDTALPATVHEVFRRAADAGLGEDDMAAVHRVLRPDRSI